MPGTSCIRETEPLPRALCRFVQYAAGSCSFLTLRFGMRLAEHLDKAACINHQFTRFRFPAADYVRALGDAVVSGNLRVFSNCSRMGNNQWLQSGRVLPAAGQAIVSEGARLVLREFLAPYLKDPT